MVKNIDLELSTYLGSSQLENYLSYFRGRIIMSLVPVEVWYLFLYPHFHCRSEGVDVVLASKGY